MQLALFIFVVMLLHLSVTTPVHNDKQDKVPIAFYKHSDPQLWLKSGKVEGDMVLTQEQQERLYKDDKNKNGMIDIRGRWPNRRVPYAFSGDFTAEERNYIAAVLQEDYARSCIRVVPRTNEADYVYITGQNTGCWSMVGRVGGVQQLNLERGVEGCIYYHTIVHEFLHAAGFYHQQSATERDDYVTIVWNNIETNQQHNFEKYGSNVISSFGQRYDYGSVMHYPAFAFSKNGQQTIIPKQNVEIGLAQRLSSTDIIKLNKMYGC